MPVLCRGIWAYLLGISLTVAARDSGERAAFPPLPSLSVISPPHQIIAKMK